MTSTGRSIVVEVAIAVIVTAVLYGLGWLVTGRRRDGLVPAAIVAGGIGLVLRQFEVLPGTPEAYQLLGYHLFGVSFLAIGLTQGPERDGPGGGVARGAVWIGVAQGLIFNLQAVVGGLLTLGLIAVGQDLFPAFGFLAPMGLEEGPGQAVSIGSIWQSAGFGDAQTLGATIASAGFVVAYGLGLVGIRLGRVRSAPTPGTAPATGPETDRDNRRIGRSVATGIGVVAAYAVIYVVVRALGGLAGVEVRDTVLGVLFFGCLLIGLGLRAIAVRVGVDLPAAPQRQVTLAAVDGLTVAVLASLAWSAIRGTAGPLGLLLAATVTVTVIAVVVLVATTGGSRHARERGIALFGTVTGTASSGLALLSLIDPEQRGPVARELGGSVIVSAPFVLAGVAVATATAQGRLPLVIATGVFGFVALLSGLAMWWLARGLRG